MSVIAVVLSQASASAQALLELHRILGGSLLEIKDKVSNREPILEVEIFDGDYQAHAELIRAVISLLKKHNITADYYEVPYGKHYSGDFRCTTWLINSETVEGVLTAADVEIERQLNG
ncbi:hypothetical protein [Pseudomonas graminis]|uniref:hypothetical protein n=1 Tax=Pseudomonas graminis TaxID=158627 RepID=UPI003C21F542